MPPAPPFGGAPPAADPLAPEPPFELVAPPPGFPALDLLEEAEHGRALVFALVQHRIEPAMKVALRHLAGHERAMAECIFERDARDAADAQAGLDRAADRFGVLQLEHDPQIRQDAVH